MLYRQLVFDGIVKGGQGADEGLRRLLRLPRRRDGQARRDVAGPADPSLAQVRSAVTEFCILPLGSQAVKDHAPLNMTLDPKTATWAPTTLLVGAPGTGKKMLVNAVANETGANLFNPTPSNTDGKYPGKKAYDMVHTVFKVAKALAPSVIWIDEGHRLQVGQGQGATGEPPNRIAKQLVAVLAPGEGLGVIDPEDRVLVMGTSARPYDGEAKGQDGLPRVLLQDRLHAAAQLPLASDALGRLPREACARALAREADLSRAQPRRPADDLAHLGVLLERLDLQRRAAHAHQAPP